MYELYLLSLRRLQNLIWPSTWIWPLHNLNSLKLHTTKGQLDSKCQPKITKISALPSNKFAGQERYFYFQNRSLQAVEQYFCHYCFFHRYLVFNVRSRRKKGIQIFFFYSIAVLLFYLHFPNSIYSALFYFIVTLYFIYFILLFLLFYLG